MKRACVIGWPVAHSRSPLIHGYWLKRYDIEGEYVKEPVHPEEIDGFISDIAAHGYIGANVTVPHKEAAFRVAENIDATARNVGAVNTLWLQDGVLCATNTDIYGFLRNLDDQVPDWDTTSLPAAILGAGGAARAIIGALLDRGFNEIRLINRTRERAENLAAIFGDVLSIHDWQVRSSALRGCGLLVNTTTLGMKSSSPLEIELNALAPRAVVHDIIYAPLETQLLARAAQHGFRVADGLGMLLHQAVPGFEKWFGVRPEVTRELRNIVLADLNA